jgi:NADH-quinone oxidoreductase subunit C
VADEETGITDPAPAAADAVSEEAAVLRTALEVLAERVSDAVLGLDGVPPEGAVLLRLSGLVDACRVLKEDPRLEFKLPLFCSVVDWVEREPRFDMVYQLRSLKLGATLRLKAQVADRLDGLPQVPTLTGIWEGMGYHEREAFDLFGIEFTGHPDLRRVLMPEDWEGHPLRKDYISFGEPDKFSDRGSFPPDAAVPRGADQ